MPAERAKSNRRPLAKTRPVGKPVKPAPTGREAKLRARLKTAEETLAAIRSGEVDALMISSHRGDLVVTLKSGAPTWQMLVEAMSEGAAILRRWRPAVIKPCLRRTDCQASGGRR